MSGQFKELQSSIGHQFEDIVLLHQALTHRSWFNESTDEVQNERLEFLGDAILGWVVADLVYYKYEELHEGRLTDIRKSVVNASALASIAREINLGAYIFLGRGEDASGGRYRESILSDTLEAVIGAVYVDAGPHHAFEVVQRLIEPLLSDEVPILNQLNPKGDLQELLAHNGIPPPLYNFKSEGPDHDKKFQATVVVNDKVLGEGHGHSKKQAERMAAIKAIDRLNETDHMGPI